MKSQTIQSAFAGLSYPAVPKKLLKQFHELLTVHAGAKTRSNGKSPETLIVPHIDFRVNLDLYAKAYARLLRLKKFPDTFYILGVGHNCPHEFSACRCDYLTPLGSVLSDDGILESIQDHCGFKISRAPVSFRREHSIEYVVIWLQAIRDLFFPEQNFQIVPILMGGLMDSMQSGSLPEKGHEITRFGEAVARAIAEQASGKSALIASIDGCHVGPRFGHPFAALSPVQHAVEKWEDELWRLCRSDCLDQFVLHLAALQNCFYFDGTGVLALLLRNFQMKAVRMSQHLWYEGRDQSFVSFSAGYFEPLRTKRENSKN
ncbi:MAG: AmmeMemoRadiSam system protein B [Methylacidiphilales bacterium]|nr:AmmeMemoRadiSam system protein B [Candidatus Methylacidiphilales bacterium]